MRRYAARFTLVLAVAAMHGLLLGYLNLASRPRVLAAADAQRIAVQMIAVEPLRPPAMPTPALPPRSSQVPSTAPAPAARAPVARARSRPDTALAVQRDAPSIAATEPAAPVTPDLPATAQPRPLDLNSEATRRALRDMDRSRPRSFAEQANGTLGNTPRSSFDTRLGAGIATARKGDCQRGEFKPWAVDVGLGEEYKLPLPGVVRALAEGECAPLGR
jgi:hypothetical protein